MADTKTDKKKHGCPYAATCLLSFETEYHPVYCNTHTSNTKYDPEDLCQPVVFSHFQGEMFLLHSSFIILTSAFRYAGSIVRRTGGAPARSNPQVRSGRRGAINSASAQSAWRTAARRRRRRCASANVAAKSKVDCQSADKM